MANYKIGRLSEDIKREISAIIRELKDPRVKDNMLSIVRVEVSNDISHAKVFVSAVKGLETATVGVQGLESASGFIKRELSNSLHMKKCPDLKFIPDGSVEYRAHIDDLLSDT